MFRQAFTAFALSAGMLFGSFAFAADPSIQQVYAAASAGHLDQAQQMMREVLRDHPDSGKAHFVEAELLAKQGDLSGARNELTRAEHLEPGLPFAKPASVQELKSLLGSTTPRSSNASTSNASTNTVSYANAPSHSGFPFGVIALLLVGAAIVAYMMRRRSHTVVMQSAPNGNAFGYGGGYQPGPASTYYGNGPGPMTPSGGGLGSGIVGGLATGAAMGAGLVAGEALVHRILDGGNHSTQPLSAPIPTGNWDDMQPGTQNYDMGGNDFGLNDDTSWDDGSSGGGSSDDW
ncbi:MAG TPA: tetratricopeptide repeat protein [Oxalicibacterium sp.]|jgi:hypothetical protein|nr:tetratricopeptide repeat protein [Oxalicibacterium sp.]